MGGIAVLIAVAVALAGLVLPDYIFVPLVVLSFGYALVRIFKNSR